MLISNYRRHKKQSANDRNISKSACGGKKWQSSRPHLRHQQRADLNHQSCGFSACAPPAGLICRFPGALCRIGGALLRLVGVGDGPGIVFLHGRRNLLQCRLVVLFTYPRMVLDGKPRRLVATLAKVLRLRRQDQRGRGDQTPGKITDCSPGRNDN
jgi:hypothetical protein